MMTIPEIDIPLGSQSAGLSGRGRFPMTVQRILVPTDLGIESERAVLRCLADKYGHPHLQRPLDNCTAGSDRVFSAAPCADKYGHISKNASTLDRPHSTDLTEDRRKFLIEGS
jgi:hypothetical protein